MASSKYPSMQQVEHATLLQLGGWWRFLPSPGEWAIGGNHAVFEKAMNEEAKVMERIGERIKELGGWTPAVSKALGWERRSTDKKVASELVQIAKDLMAAEFPSEHALEMYLKNHPGANKADHKVVEQYSQYDDKERPLGILRRHGAQHE